MTPRFPVVLLISFILFMASPSLGGHIDQFETAHSAETSVAAPPSQGVGSTANPTATALGVERDLFINKTSGDDDERLRARVNPLGATKLRIDADAQVEGSVFVTWDGEDGNPNPFSGVDFNGLGGVDLTQAGAWAGFSLSVSFSDVGGPIKLSVFDNSSNSAAAVASGTFNVPGGIPVNTPTPIMLPFSSFTGTTSALTDAGAVLMEVMDSNGGWDLNIVALERYAIPEPGTAGLIYAGSICALLLRRLRRSPNG